MHLWKFLDGCRVRNNVLTIVNYFIDNHHGIIIKIANLCITER